MLIGVPRMCDCPPPRMSIAVEDVFVPRLSIGPKSRTALAKSPGAVTSQKLLSRVGDDDSESSPLASPVRMVVPPRDTNIQYVTVTTSGGGAGASAAAMDHDGATGRLIAPGGRTHVVNYGAVPAS